MIKVLFLDFLVLTTTPEILLRILLCPETLKNKQISKYAQWIYRNIGE